MSDNQQTQMSKSTNQTADNIEESFQGLKIHGSRDSSVRSSPNPGRTMERDCPFYMKTGGLCAYGNNCRFNHPANVSKGAIYHYEELPERVGQPDCEYFLKRGTCKYGSTCKYNHPKDRNGAGPVSFNILGFPMREGELACPFYMRNGTCKFAAGCKFHHPEPASHGNAIAGKAQASFPSLNLPFVGGFPSLPLPTATYGSGLHIQNSQTYVPVPIMFSPSPGVLPPHGWNSYLGNASSSSTAPFNPIYDPKNQANSYFGSQLPVMAISAPNLPEKPDQPECWFFMNYGICRYGADCRYNHPKERKSQLCSAAPNPFSLPSRPGQPICSNFISSGFCKFGPDCRFDHSFLTYSLNYGFAIPPISTYSSIPVAFPKISPANNVSETSHPVKPNNPDTKKPPKEQNGENKETPEAKKEKVDSQLQACLEDSHE